MEASIAAFHFPVLCYKDRVLIIFSEGGSNERNR